MKDNRVVKGIHVVDLKDAGDPVENAAYCEQEGADELAMLDITATVENRKTRLASCADSFGGLGLPLPNFEYKEDQRISKGQRPGS